MKPMLKQILVMGVTLVVVSAPTSLAASTGGGTVQPAGFYYMICHYIPIACS
ncbi:hypothetical protein [Raineyella sp. W15-4]|uniref:hypothetical protein n=1 Tax=Raineyella sp. W15-4 TaxID=3081651 RepID=UPI00295305D6|nr:hypothetical protein [Raineyella sp. W15-4]WOQ18817.1 hypothetical protein R0145_09185 [Raineyella sp. W15-4]